MTKKENIKLIWKCLVKTTQVELIKDLDLIVMGFIVRDQLDNIDQCHHQVQRRC